MRRRNERVLAIRHWRRAGVICHASDNHVVAIDRDDSLDDAHRNAQAFEGAALLDVELQIAVVAPRGVASLIRPGSLPIFLIASPRLTPFQISSMSPASCPPP